MSTPDGGSASGPHVPEDLTQRLRDARVSTAELMERLLASAQSGDTTFEARPGTEMLLFWCRGMRCAVPLTALREVLPEPPKAVYLPFSPAWMFGVFPLRNELVGLVDPAPLLFGPNAPAATSARTGGPSPSASLTGLPGARPPQAAALIIGTEDRCLAWMVDAVGEITNAQDEDMLPASEAAAAAGPIAPHYVLGVYRDGPEGEACITLRAEALLDDLLAALEEGADGGGDGGDGGEGEEARRG